MSALQHFRKFLTDYVNERSLFFGAPREHAEIAQLTLTLARYTPKEGEGDTNLYLLALTTEKILKDYFEEREKQRCTGDHTSRLKNGYSAHIDAMIRESGVTQENLVAPHSIFGAIKNAFSQQVFSDLFTGNNFYPASIKNNGDESFTITFIDSESNVAGSYNTKDAHFIPAASYPRIHAL